jgi:hypothetical protein
VQVGDLVKHYDQLYSGLGLVVDISGCQTPGWEPASVLVSYADEDCTYWISIEDLELVNGSR